VKGGEREGMSKGERENVCVYVKGGEIERGNE